MGKFVVIVALIALLWFVYGMSTRSCWMTVDEHTVTNRLGTYRTTYKHNDESCLWVRTWSLENPCGTTGCFSH
jgi:hypothetical protein